MRHADTVSQPVVQVSDKSWRAEATLAAEYEQAHREDANERRMDVLRMHANARAAATLSDTLDIDELEA